MSRNALVRHSGASKSVGVSTTTDEMSGATLTMLCVEPRRFWTYVPYLKVHIWFPLPYLQVC
jgi:hypothetical protein